MGSNNAHNRAKSQGLRPDTCSPVGSGFSNPLDLLWGIRNVAQSLLNKGQNIINNPLGTAIDISWSIIDFTTKMHEILFNLPARLREMTWEQTLEDLEEVRRGDWGIAAGMVIGSLPVIGGIYDAISLQLGFDPITGESLSSFEKAAIAAGLAAGFLGVFSFIDDAS